MINQDKVQLTINVINNDENNLINNHENNVINNDENNLINNHENNLINNHENNLINNHENNLICVSCSRPILPKDFDELIDLNYRDTPKFFKSFLKNEWINGYKLINKKVNLPLNSLPENLGDKRSLDVLNPEGKLPSNKLPRKIAFQKWQTYLDKGQERCIAACEKMIKKIIISDNKELNLTHTDKNRFREELNNLKIKFEELNNLQTLRNQQRNNLNSDLNALRAECRLEEDSHEDLYEHENMHEDSREDSYEHMHEHSHNNGQEHNI